MKLNIMVEIFKKALKTLRNSDLMPYVIYVGPPSLNKLKELKMKMNEHIKVRKDILKRI